ncbi:efflux RND transporter periplasmic adaptor subunit [Lignipirellula cremea]|uniref:Multidrug resistance protein MdtN n=1 Tax=Lignipirellula cremea TaxID=2528010 RepID=A0A518DZS0_9BACT|nr:HlyD family efflux transporter periplasmic adaptor subunit [Lignipirellula cremea]QDU97311.1 Multidrug resistance protein MdtN [Lignipirellula cremea]
MGSQESRHRDRAAWLVLAAGLVACCGCQSSRADDEKKSPRPVTVLELRETNPLSREFVGGSVASWKTEEIGFEVAGRVQFVAELDVNVDGRLYHPDGQIQQKGDLIARIDPYRYELQVASAKARIKTAEEQKRAATIEAEKAIPAQGRAAETSVRVALSELERRRPLLERGTISQEDFDRAQAAWEQATAEVAQLDAQQDAKRAEIASFDAQIQELQEALSQAERDREECQLYAPYDGQIAQVHVIPGAYVERGQAVVTLQMMDPITVEVEASAATTRRLKHDDMVPFYTARADGGLERRMASVYSIDPTADPQTRTFTITLIVLNQVISASQKATATGESTPVVAQTTDLRRVIPHKLGGRNYLFMEEKALQQDADGYFIWKVLNRDMNTLSSDSDPMLQVKKVRLTPGDQRASFLGMWNFRNVEVDPKEFNFLTDLATGLVVYPQGVDAATFQGDRILLNRERWLLRPGDLVKVDLTEGAQAGLYVPESAILSLQDRQYLFVVQSTDKGSRVRRVPIRVFEAVDTLRRVEGIEDDAIRPGVQVAASGALFLSDGEAVNVVEVLEQGQ